MKSRRDAEPELRKMNLRDDCLDCPFLYRLYQDYETFEDLTEEMLEFVNYYSLPSADLNSSILATIACALEDYDEGRKRRYGELVSKLQSISYACNVGPSVDAPRPVNSGYEVIVYECNSNKLPPKLGNRAVSIYRREEDGTEFINFSK